MHLSDQASQLGSDAPESLKAELRFLQWEMGAGAAQQIAYGIRQTGAGWQALTAGRNAAPRSGWRKPDTFAFCFTLNAGAAC
ncbi:MAG: hypothetical protein ACJ8G3_26905, partial [Burkholderiaceae bacterium]